MIPASVAFRYPGDATAHAVGRYSTRAFCGQLAAEDTGRPWPESPDEWTEPHLRCPLCAALVYT